MSHLRYVQAVADHLTTRLHQTGNEYRCACGACTHQVRMSALRARIRATALLAVLPPQRAEQAAA